MPRKRSINLVALRASRSKSTSLLCLTAGNRRCSGPLFAGVFSRRVMRWRTRGPPTCGLLEVCALSTIEMQSYGSSVRGRTRSRSPDSDCLRDRTGEISSTVQLLLSLFSTLLLPYISALNLYYITKSTRVSVSINLDNSI